MGTRLLKQLPDKEEVAAAMERLAPKPQQAPIPPPVTLPDDHAVTLLRKHVAGAAQAQAGEALYFTIPLAKSTAYVTLGELAGIVESLSGRERTTAALTVETDGLGALTALLVIAGDGAYNAFIETVQEYLPF